MYVGRAGGEEGGREGGRERWKEGGGEGGREGGKVREKGSASDHNSCGLTRVTRVGLHLRLVNGSSSFFLLSSAISSYGKQNS